MKLKVKIDMHREQCNVVVIIKYEIKSTKTLEDTISWSEIHNFTIDISSSISRPGEGPCRQCLLNLLRIYYIKYN